MSGKPFTNIEISAFCGQMALILKSGVSAMEGISIMQEDSQSREEHDILRNIGSELASSGSLFSALRSTGLFPEYMLSLVHIGEETGTLDEVTAALETHYSKEDSIRRSIRSSLTFPMIMIGMMIVVILVLLIKVLPVFNQVFIQLGSEMTGFSRGLLKIGNSLSSYSAVFIGILSVILILCIAGFKTESGRKALRNICRRIGFTRRIFESTSSCRFAGGMALTLKAGLTPDRSLELVRELTDDEHFTKKLTEAESLMEKGAPLSRALFETGIFTGVYARMASVGEKTGRLDSAMDRIAVLYQEEIDTRINNVLSVIEPVLVASLSLIVGIILISVMLPLLGIMSSI